MENKQKTIPPLKPINKSLPPTTLGAVPTPKNVKGSMDESKVPAKDVIKKLEEAVKDGAFEGADVKK